MTESLIGNILTAERCCYSNECKTKKSTIQFLSNMIANDLINVNEHDIFTQLTEREKLGSTAIGCGVAIPHIRSHLVTAPIGAFLHLRHPIKFEADDGGKVDLVFCLVVPEHVEQTHLEILSSLAETFNDPENRKMIRKTRSSSDTWHVFHSITQEKELAHE